MQLCGLKSEGRFGTGFQQDGFWGTDRNRKRPNRKVLSGTGEHVADEIVKAFREWVQTVMVVSDYTLYTCTGGPPIINNCWHNTSLHKRATGRDRR